MYGQYKWEIGTVVYGMNTSEINVIEITIYEEKQDCN